MIPIALAAVLLLAAPQQTDPSSVLKSDLTREQRLEQAREKYEPTRLAAVHMNDLAGATHSEADARAFIDEVAERLGENQHHTYLSWTTRSIRHRVAHAEFEAVSDPARLIPEQRIVDVWNEYVRELDAPEETLLTVAELHNLRDATYTSVQFMWKRGGFTQQLWTIPSIYAVGADGKVASGCRAVETLKILHDMFYLFQNVRAARERVQKGVLASDLARQREQQRTDRPPVTRSRFIVSRDANPLLPAEVRYVQAHGQRDYSRLLERLFEELFPKE